MPKFAELKREFRKAGCELRGQYSGHEEWYSPITGETFPMSRHNNQEVKKGMEMELRKQAGVPKKR